MPSFGEWLRREREARDRPIEEIAGATGIQLAYLEALERSEFAALPGPAFGKLYIRAYAEVLGFDPGPLIHEYDRQLSLEPRVAADPPRPEPVRPRRVEAVMAAWREARIARRNEPERGAASGEAGREMPAGTRAGAPPDLADREPREEEVPGVRRAEAASDRGPSIPRMAPGSKRPLALALLLVGIVMGALGAYFGLFRAGIEEGGSPPGLPSEPGAPGEDPPPVVTAREPGTVHDREASTAPPPVEPASGPLARPGHLTVPEFGVGRRIVRRRLEGRDDRFPVGGVVWFSTRVLGGEPGGHVRHVWLHEGRVLQSIRLRLGGPDWRTQSSKTLRDPGRWVVEVRDEAGGVLARTGFTSVRAGP